MSRHEVTRRAAARDSRADELAALVYELLDAHSDTTQLAAEHEHDGDVRWRAHLDYLRALQRTGREALARTSHEEAP